MMDSPVRYPGKEEDSFTQDTSNLSPGPQEDISDFHDRIRKNLTRELSRVIKKIQHDHISSDSAVRSGDTANAVCNVIEAIFLHGLRESFSNKSFWQFLVSFTHKDVVKQLNHLAQITTEIGQCRAWIRLALNDSLMESYIGTILQDSKKLEQYYHRYSYLRDTEQPHIMKNYLQGLGDFVFQLSYNSSVLNMWGSTPLKLAGLGGPGDETPVAVIAINPSPSSEQSTVAEPPATSPVEITAKRPAKKSRAKHKPADEVSTGSGSGLEELVSPSAEFSFRESEMSSGLLATPPDDSMLSQHRGNGTDDSSLGQQATASQVYGSTQLDAENRRVVSNYDDKGQKKEVENLCKEGASDDSSKMADETEEALSGAQDTKISSEADMTRTQSHDTEESSENGVDSEIQSETARFDLSLSPKMRVSPRLSDAVAEVTVAANVEDAAEVSQGYVESMDNNAGEDIETGVAAGEDDDMLSFMGNSLIARSGWSSEFEKQRTPETPDREVVSPVRERGDSFGTLLQNYAPNNRTAPSSMIPDLLKQVPDQDRGPAKDQPRADTAEDSNSVTENDFEVVPLAQSMTAISNDPRTHALLTILTELSTEKGLDSQNYQCKGCSRPIGIIYGKAKVCSYDACYYCYECHVDDEAVIPSRIIHNWDFSKHKVAKLTKLFLQQVEDEPLINLKQCNPSIYNYINELNDIKQLRVQLNYLKAYLFTCKQSVAEEMRRRIWPREYMLDNVNVYSIADLKQVQSGQQAQNLKKIINFAAKHIKGCSLCSQKGFICEICDNPKVIYPFDLELTVRCEKCHTVFHKACKTDTKACPKCNRRKLRQVDSGQQSQEVDFASPWHGVS
ncbi:pleckstrin homology domain-containing family M member 1-like isoform X3 [Ptychodera flava]|uniref:pleckstrin homology domain-containing family M member 1-like isoform X3 n=1 Tax=Ptychodera flava TaxID=63121 RepID=UPI003969D2FB